MTTMWGAPLHKRWRGSRLRDPRQARFLTLASLKWVLANRAYTPWYLVRYVRLLKFKLANPHIITRGMVFLGKGVEIQATPELSTMEIGRWVHIGDKNTIRCHEGSLRFGDKVVLGRDNVINTYLDIELGDSVLMADWVYVCDFDHRMDDINVPIKDQGILKGPVRIGPDTWIATKVTILRNTTIGRGCVLGSHAVVKGDIPDYAIAVGAPAKVVKNRKLAWETSAAERAELAAALADIERKKASRNFYCRERACLHADTPPTACILRTLAGSDCPISAQSMPNASANARRPSSVTVSARPRGTRLTQPADRKRSSTARPSPPDR